MKTLLTFFVLLFSSSVVADDISDLEIEGISVGDSLLNYYSEEDIKKNIYDQISQIRETKFYDVIFFSSKFREYQAIQVALKFGDNNYIIYGIDGLISFGDRIEDCIKKQKNITKKLMEEINYVDFQDRDVMIHPDYNDGTTTKDTFLVMNNNAQIIISCLDAPDYTGGDFLRVGFWSKELNDWLAVIK